MYPAQDVFTRICRSVEDLHTGAVLLCDEAGTTLENLRPFAGRGELGNPERIEAWQRIAHHMREEAAGGAGADQDWTLIALWLLAPRLRGGAYAIARRTGAERGDVCSALLAGALEAVQGIEGTDATQIEQYLVDAAFAVGWRTGRRRPMETPVGEVRERDSALLETELPLSTAACGEVVDVDAMSGALAQRAQGERLGSLAYRMGLLAHVRQVRRESRARQRQPRAGSHRAPGEPSGQPSLFEIWGCADEAPS